MFVYPFVHVALFRVEYMEFIFVHLVVPELVVVLLNQPLLQTDCLHIVLFEAIDERYKYFNIY